MIYNAQIAGSPAADGGVMVLIDDLDESTYRHGPCFGWTPRPDDREPRRGDPCAVLEMEDRWWVLAWQPDDEEA